MKVYGDLNVKGTLKGINFTDGVHTTPNTSLLAFGSEFYLSTGKTTGVPRVNLSRPIGTDFNDGISTYLSQTGLGFSPNFYLSKGATASVPVLNIRNPFTKVLALEFPGAAENLLIFRAHEAMRIVSARAVVQGASSPSVTLVIQSGTSRGTLTVNHVNSFTVTSTTTGDQLPLAIPAIPAGSWVCLATSATGGTVFELDISLQVEWV
jgi:hypothetical protein